jgi:hypothetical protein
MRLIRIAAVSALLLGVSADFTRHGGSLDYQLLLIDDLPAFHVVSATEAVDSAAIFTIGLKDVTELDASGAVMPGHLFNFTAGNNSFAWDGG